LRPYLKKKPNPKRVGAVGIGPEFKPQYHKKQKRKEKKKTWLLSKIGETY
jgi:hypothetical protein